MEIKRLYDKWWKIATIVILILSVIIAASLTGVYVSMNNARIDSVSSDLISDTTRFIAHRGYSSKYYQNSYDAYLNAAKEEAFSGIECDIWRTVDGVWLTAHDDNPFEDKSIRISKSKYADIKDLTLRESNAGKGVTDISGHRICTLEEYMTVCKDYGKLAVIELKPEFDAETLMGLDDYVSSKLDKSEYCYISFKRDNLVRLFNINKDINMMYLSIMGIDGSNHIERGYNVGVNHSMTDAKSLIKTAKKYGKATNFWTINDNETIKKLVEAGADFVTTDIVPSL